VRGGLAVGDDQHDRFGFGVPAQVPSSQRQCVLQVGALHPLGLDRRELDRSQSPREPVEADDLQRVAAKASGDQVSEGERGLLHRSPSGPPAPSRTTGPRTTPQPPACGARSQRRRSLDVQPDGLPAARRRASPPPTALEMPAAAPRCARSPRRPAVAHRRTPRPGPLRCAPRRHRSGRRRALLAGRVEGGEDPAQRRLAQPSQRLRASAAGHRCHG
jgi:hypothetical protein